MIIGGFAIFCAYVVGFGAFCIVTTVLTDYR